MATGDLQVTQWQLTDLKLTTLEGRFGQTGVLEGMDPVQGVVQLFVQRGSLHLSSPSFDHEFPVGAQSHTCLFLGATTVQFAIGELDLAALMVQWDTGAFLRVAQDAAPVWQHFAQSVKAGPSLPLQLFDIPLTIDLAIHACIRQVVNCSMEAVHAQLFFLAKAMELMALQADCLHRHRASKPLYIKTEYDRERLLFAKDYLLQHMALPPSLPELAHITGINEFKLKRGFKELFGSTVFGYLAEARLEWAKAHLIDGGKTATEIAFELGYASLQHFSTAFKKKFGVSPTGK